MMKTEVMHIARDPDVLGGKPHVEGHRIAVHHIAWWYLQGASPEELARDYQLTPGEVHAALAYYYDHQAEIDRELAGTRPSPDACERPSPNASSTWRMDERLHYYLDEHMRPAIAHQLRARGVDVMTTAEAGRAARRISDVDQLAFATANNQVLVTEDSDFVQLATAGQPHAGIVYFPVQLDIGACTAYLELLALTTTPDEMRNQLLFGAW